MKKTITAVIMSLVLTACTLGMEAPASDSPDQIAPVSENEPATPENKNYDMSGTAKFETIVNGYLKVEEEEIFDEKIDIPYLVITGFAEEGFQKSIESLITDGNSVNKRATGLFYFNLGCFEDGKIKGNNYPNEDLYLDTDTSNAILSSTVEEPVKLKLYFGYHEGRGCICCNLAHQIRVIE